MIQMTLIQIDNYGPWTVTPRPRTESDLQMLQASLFADLNNHFGNKKGLVFFTRFDNLLAISNGLDEEDHLRIQRSIRNRYPITVSMDVGAAETPHEAQKLATIALQKAGSAQSGERKEILAIDSLVSEDDSFVQAAHIDINSVTETLTDIESAFDTSFMVNKAQHYLMTKLIKKGALLFFIGGDNFMSPCNGLSEKEIFQPLQSVLGSPDRGCGAGAFSPRPAHESAGRRKPCRARRGRRHSDLEPFQQV